MALADVNDTQPSRRDQIVERFLDRIANISGMRGAVADKPYQSFGHDKLPHTWIVDTTEDAEPFSTGMDLFTLQIITWTEFVWNAQQGETVRDVGRRILKAMLIGGRSRDDDETLGEDNNGAQLCISIQPGPALIEPSGEGGDRGIVKMTWTLQYLAQIDDPSSMGGN